MNISFMTRLCAALCLLISVQSARAQEEPLPTWPRQFSVQGPQDVSFGFVLTQPGPIVVDVQVDGAPVFAMLEGPAQRPVAQQQGNGALRLAYTAAPNEVQNGTLWIIRVKLAAPGPNAAKGIVNVQHPPVDQARVLATTRSFKAQARAQRAQLERGGEQQQMAQFKARMDAELRNQNAQLDQQNVQRRNALMAQLQPAVERLRAGSVATSAPRVMTRAVAPSGPVNRQSAAGISRPDRGAIIKEPPVSSSQPIEAAGPGGNIQNVAPNPAIDSLSVTNGRPGDPILISGSGFGNAIGEVHFLLGPTNDFRVPETPQAAAGLFWSDSQIFVTVPNVSGLRPFNGTVYVTRAGDQLRSNLAPLAFVPLMERRHILSVIPEDKAIGETGDVIASLHPVSGGWGVSRANFNCFSGSTSNDRFFNQTRLQNGWRVSAPPTIQYPYPSSVNGGAYVAESRLGTDWPYLDVKWWINVGAFCFSQMHYAIVIPIEGPLGTSDGVVVK